MSFQDESTNARSLKYVSTFDVKLFDVGCDVDVVISLETGDAIAVISMRPFLRSSPAFKISLENLKSVLAAVLSAKANAELLLELADGAEAHQLQYQHGGALLTVVHPARKKVAMAVLTIGMFSREAELDKLSVDEIAFAISTCECLIATVKAKVASAKS